MHPQQVIINNYILVIIVLDNCLKCIHVPIESINCNNMLCNESVHINCITKFHDDIVLAAIMASDVIPETVKKSNHFPGWTKETSYLRELLCYGVVFGLV